MKYSGIAIALIGICILLYTVVAGVAAGNAPTTEPVATRSRMDLVVPVAMGACAVAIGAGMYFFGGRGYIKTRNPAVRN
jgi:hypothetical protein